MPDLLALDWDGHEARIAVGQKRGGRLVVVQAASIERSARATDAARPTSDLGPKLAQLLSSYDLSRPKTLVALGRSSIELKHLSLPPAPLSELPEMVRLQAQKEFSALTDDWPLDYLPLVGNAEQLHQTLAAAISPEVLAQVVDTCRSAGLKPRRVVLRPCAAASLLARKRLADGERIRLLIDLLGEEAELTVLADRSVVFIRAVRLPVEVLAAGNHGDRCKVLAAEIRRTIGAVRNQLGGSRVNAIYLCSDGQEQADLAAQIEQRLSVATHVFDPLAEVTLGRTLRQARPAHAGRFAPLVGVLLDEFEGVTPGIDFLDPRKTPERRSHWKVAALLATVAVLLIVGRALRTWTDLAHLDAKIAAVSLESAGLENLLERSQDAEREAARLERWMLSDVVWLDELKRLAEILPDPDEAMLTQVQLVPDAAAGTLVLRGRVRSHEIVDEFERDLRDRHHRVDPKLSQQDRSNPRYSWQFKSSMAVVPGTGAPATERAAPGAGPTPSDRPPTDAGPGVRAGQRRRRRQADRQKQEPADHE